MKNYIKLVIFNIQNKTLKNLYDFSYQFNLFDILNLIANETFLKGTVFTRKNNDIFFFHNIFYYRYRIDVNDTFLAKINKNNIIFKIFDFINMNLFSNFFCILFLFNILIFCISLTFAIFEEEKNQFFKYYSELAIIWLKFFGEKLDNHDEAYLTFKFLPFFMFLFFSHLFFIDNFSNLTIFIEWSLPVMFGIFIILESIWLFGSHIFIYLNGSKTRNLFLFSLFEDSMNLFILITRILLQMVRGLICSLYHDFLREVSINIFQKIDNYFFVWNAMFKFQKIGSWWMVYLTFYKFFMFLIILTFAVLLMFLQILFLFLAIWLFCRCWFMSLSYHNIYPVESFKFHLKNKIKQL